MILMSASYGGVHDSVDVSVDDAGAAEDSSSDSGAADPLDNFGTSTDDISGAGSSSVSSSSVSGSGSGTHSDAVSSSGAGIGYGVNLVGTDGNDLLTGAASGDTLIGGFGSDLLSGNNLDDTLIGNKGHDLLKGGDGDVCLEGGSGDDTLKGEAGNDTLKVETGKDTLVGGTDNNFLYGDDGTEVAIFDGNFVDFKVTDLSNGLVELRCSDSVDIVSNVETFTFKDGTISLADLLAGRGPNAMNTINGTDGQDWVKGISGNDKIFGGDGDDLVHGDAGNDKIESNLGDGILKGGSSKDSPIGGVVDDALKRLSGDDSPVGGKGYDQRDGGEATDTAIFTGQSTDYSVTDNGHGTIRVVGANSVDVVTQVDNLKFDDKTIPTADIVAPATPTATTAPASPVTTSDTEPAATSIRTATNTPTSATAETTPRGIGNNFPNGGEATDTAVFINKFAENTITDLGKGVVEIRSNGNVDIVSNVEWFTFADGTVSLADVLAGRGPSTIKVIDGTVGQDNLFGTAVDDAIAGGRDNYLVEGNAGNDTLDGEASADLLVGGSGGDSVKRGEGDHIRYGDYTAPNSTVSSSYSSVLTNWWSSVRSWFRKW